MNRQQRSGEMAAKTELEERISRTLTQQAESLQVTSADEERMRCSVHRRIEEESGMRKWSARKIVIMAAAVCVLGTITAVAAGKVANTSSHGYLTDQFTYDKLGEMEAKVGFTTRMPEEFDNGYRFDTGLPIERTSTDDSDQVVQQATDLSFTYKKSGMPDVSVYVESTTLYGAPENPDQTFDHNGITVSYQADQYRFVPPDYQVSEEEQAKMDAGELAISYGSDQVEDQVIKNLSWQDGDLHYEIITSDSSLTAEEMAQMAGEIIDNK